MQKEHHTIPIMIINTIINTILLFKVTEMEFAVEYVFCVFVAVCIGFLSFSYIYSPSYFLVFSILIGVGIFLYTSPFIVISRVYLAIEFAFLTYTQTGAKEEFATHAKKLQKAAKTENGNVAEDILSGMNNKDVCEKYDMKPYQVTRLKQKLEQNL